VIGTKLAHYEITSHLGSGGMGDVYQARDYKLGRDVALKFLPESLAHGAEREARVLASLNHPNIAAIYGIENANGKTFLVMELVSGETLAERIERGPIPIEDALRIAEQIAEALTAAHAKGVIHRDLKPANIKMTADGKVKVLDFGLARQFEAPGADSATVTIDRQSVDGKMVGTIAYMSPEQAEGRALDERSDIFALGVVLYEMLCGRSPFKGDSALSTLASILREAPVAPRELRPSIPPEVERIVLRCLAKQPSDRPGSAASVAHELQRLTSREKGVIHLRHSVLAVGVAVFLIAAVLWGFRWYKARWAETTAIPQAAALFENSQPLAALKLVREAERYVPASPALIRLKEDLILLPNNVQTTPPGADIYITDYVDPMSTELSHWTYAGRSPLTVSLPRISFYRFRIVKEGYETVETTTTLNLNLVVAELHTKADTPPGMVWIAPPERPVTLGVVGVPIPPVVIPPGWLDKYEITNRQYKAFIDAGGYQNKNYWKQPFLENGKELPFETAIARFHDVTGKQGPSTWEGTYPDGQADFPVSGVSWFEAAAYAEYAGKSLPTVYQWYIAAGIGITSQIMPLSNFSRKGPVAVGTTLGLGPFGNYDMAGNVKEWTFNNSGEKRYILGGGWNEASYMFQQGDLRSPWDREVTFGFRCARNVSDIPDALTGPVVQIISNRSGDRPVDDRTFEQIRKSFEYDHTDFKATTDSVKDAPHWRQEIISFPAPYGNERVILHLYLPKDARPPYPTVFYFGGANMLLVKTPEEVSNRLMESIIKSGRAVALPAYADTLERSKERTVLLPPALQRDLYIQTFKDTARTIDYLETRGDIDVSHLGFYGLSLGTAPGIVDLAIEPRFKVAVLVSAGTRAAARYPESDTWNYAPRVKKPVLMLNGTEDSLSPVESGQVPLFKALGTPAEDKKYKTYPGGHVDFIDRTEVITEALQWLDKYQRK
jgi:formylglycine-generating enzyme required for sulfatase activity/dienelactone hydrolase